MRLCVWSLLLFACLTGENARAAVLNFNGGGVNGCTLSSNTYTCSSFPLPGSTDTMAIASGYTVAVKSSAVFGNGQSLTMSGSATLKASGDLDISNISSGTLSIGGGNLVSGGTLTVGNQVPTITANLSAAAVSIASGSGTRIVGNVTASGTITIGTNAIVSGSVTGGTVNANPQATIDGSVSASRSFTMGSGGTVSGNIVAPVTILSSANTSVGGNITATTSLELGSQASVNGDVATGSLVLDSSNAIIYGNATVDSAILNQAGRVVKTIYCTGGTTKGQCDCVTNNSGYPVNSVSGPHCAAVPPAFPIDHFLVLHDGTASACTPEPVTVKACADAACSSLYKGGVNITLQPGGGSFAIGSSGASTNATVSQSSTGNVVLNVSASSVAVANPVQCDNTTDSFGAGSAYCAMNFNNSIGLSLSIPDQYAAVTTSFSLAAAVLDPSGKSCKPAWPGKTQPVQLSCAYANPARGSQALAVSSDGAGFSALNANNASAGLCDGSARSFNVSFPSDGSAATLSMKYGDVGQLRIDASTTDNGKSFGTSGKFIVAPYAFQISSFPTLTTAGVPFNVVATALTAAGQAAPNFGLETADPAIAAETVQFSLGAPGSQAQGCQLTASMLGSLSPPPTTSVIATGILGKLGYTEAGALNIQVQQASSNYLGGSKARPAAVQTGAASGCGAIVSVPAWFQVKEGRVGAGLPNFYYSGEPLDLSVTAMNALGSPTRLYDGALGYSNPVVLSAWDAAGGQVIDPNTVGKLSGAGTATPLPASAFTQGVASLYTTSPSSLVFSFTSAPHAPLAVRLRAAETVSNGVSSASAASYGKTAEDVYEARSGRLTIASRFGSATGDLTLPVTFQYWTGASWIRNLAEIDGLHRLPSAAFAVQPKAPLSAAVTPAGTIQGRLIVDRGLGSVTLRPTGGAGTATVAINLGGTMSDNACLPVPPARPASTGAVMPYLRGPNGICTGTAAASADPVARATFGATMPEAKRIVHTREVFN